MRPTPLTVSAEASHFSPGSVLHHLIKQPGLKLPKKDALNRQSPPAAARPGPLQRHSRNATGSSGPPGRAQRLTAVTFHGGNLVGPGRANFGGTVGAADVGSLDLESVDKWLNTIKSIKDFRYSRVVDQGVILVRPLTPEYVIPTVNILNSVVSENLLYESEDEDAQDKFLRKELIANVSQRLGEVPDAVILVALLFPCPLKDSSELSKTLGAPGSEAPKAVRPLLLGTTEVSFSDSTRTGVYAAEPDSMATPPANVPYISNTAVLRQVRGIGAGRALLRAAEELTKLRAAVSGEKALALYTHVMEADMRMASKLYEFCGFQRGELGRMVMQHMGVEQMRLMIKRI